MLLSCADPSAPAPRDAPVLQALKVSDAAVPAADAGDMMDASLADASALLAPEPKIGRAEAIDLLFTSMKDGVTPPPCEGDDAVKCLLDARYAKDDAARDVAVSLFEKTGSVAGVDKAHIMDGGYRGMLHLVPVLPLGASKVHLQHMSFALTGFDTFFQKLESRANSRVTYRWRNLALRFFRSVKARTPSAYASGWTIAYNVDGSLNKSDDAVRETMFHEIFHLNDADHGARGDDWSEHALAQTYDAIVANCKASTPCLSKYAPNDTMVRGGTYYAFQPGNDVREYAAELSVRYFKEESAAIAGTTSQKPFKCTGSENAKSWNAMVHEFFADIDLTPACP
ncbi:MAG: hypothetical protein ABI183_21330 [Polyangiaceae bacterium]